MGSAGCGDTKTHISASDYNQSCEGDDECVRVFEGNVCGCGQPAAVNIDAREEFREDTADETELQRRMHRGIPAVGTGLCRGNVCGG
jgi:hypothetical protein